MRPEDRPDLWLREAMSRGAAHGVERGRSRLEHWSDTATRMRTAASPLATCQLMAPSGRRPGGQTASHAASMATLILTVSRGSTPTLPAFPARWAGRRGPTCRLWMATVRETTITLTQWTHPSGSVRPRMSSWVSPRSQSQTSVSVSTDPLLPDLPSQPLSSCQPRLSSLRPQCSRGGPHLSKALHFRTSSQLLIMADKLPSPLLLPASPPWPPPLEPQPCNSRHLGPQPDRPWWPRPTQAHLTLTLSWRDSP